MWFGASIQVKQRTVSDALLYQLSFGNQRYFLHQNEDVAENGSTLCSYGVKNVVNYPGTPG
jgi:hypothetical protein